MSLSSRNRKNIPKPTHFGKNLRFLRRMKGLSQSELANQIGLSRNNIASYESGVVEPNMKKFLEACTFFSTEPRKMLDTVLSDNPADISQVIDDSEKIVDKYIIDEMEQFVIQTNEMTKVFEGYNAFIEMKKESDSYYANIDLYATLQDLLELLHSLIEANWNLIQSVYPAKGEEE